jgi:hypothetical protein
MTFLVKVQNQGDQYVKVTGDAIEVHVKPGDAAEILAEDGASLALAQETEEDAILAMTALSLPDLAETEVVKEEKPEPEHKTRKQLHLNIAEEARKEKREDARKEEERKSIGDKDETRKE